MDPGAFQPQPGATPPAVSYNLFLGIIWGGVAISGLMVLCRFYFRLSRGPRRLYIDDFCSALAFIPILVTGAIWQWAGKDLYYTLNVEAGLAQPEGDFVLRFYRWLKAGLVSELSFHTCLVLIKFSLLFFFWRLGRRAQYFKYSWWLVAFLCTASYIAALGTFPYKCALGPFNYIIVDCNTPASIHYAETVRKIDTALDTLTDFLIMLLPAILLWKVQIPWTKKLAILGIFSLSIITVAVAITRVLSISDMKREDGQSDPSYLWLWTSIEQTVAMVVSCLSAFPQLFNHSQRKKKATFAPMAYYRQVMSRAKPQNMSQRGDWYDLAAMSRSRGFDEAYVPTDSDGSLEPVHSCELPIMLPMAAASTAKAYADPYAELSGSSSGIRVTYEVSVQQVESIR
ncbi:hypothetical protein F4777DRAFT_69679 [Nemania sp. FL0916]|nr:hypothetical protein F4777DRAFT_69679 [Nemania sp. FL0916]